MLNSLTLMPHASNKKLHDVDALDQQILDLEQQIKGVQKIIGENTESWLKYEILFRKKRDELLELKSQYARLIAGNADLESQMIDIEEKINAMQENLGILGFGVSGEGFDGSEDFFNFFEGTQRQNRQKLEEYEPGDETAIDGALSMQLQDMDCRTIYIKIAKVLHDDVLPADVKRHDDYCEYLEDIRIKLYHAYENDDKVSMVLLIQEANIKFVDGKFVLADYQTFLGNVSGIIKRKKIEGLKSSLADSKSNPVYIFYTQSKNGDIQNKLQLLDDQIEQLQDLIDSIPAS